MHLRLDDPLPPEDWAERPAPVDIDQLYRAQSPRLTRFFARRAPHDDVRDLVQESFRRLIGILSASGVRLGSPEAYLHRVAGNILRDRSRSAREKLAPSQAEYREENIGGPDAERHLQDRDMLIRIDAVLAKLKPKTREIFMMHRLDGLSYAEIAERMGMSVKGVEYQLTKALDELRRRVERP